MDNTQIPLSFERLQQAGDHVAVEIPKNKDLKNKATLTITLLLDVEQVVRKVFLRQRALVRIQSGTPEIKTITYLFNKTQSHKNKKLVCIKVI